MFFVLEGVDGCGKSTQAKLLAARLQENGYDVLQVADPGTTSAGKRIREIVLDKSLELSPTAQALLFAAARVTTAERIKSHLAAGGVVVADRWIQSTVAYQGYAQRVDLNLVAMLTSTSLLGVSPDLTLVLDIERETALARREGRHTLGACGAPALRAKDRFEAEGVEFYRRLHDVYAELATHQNCELLPVEGYSVSVVHDMILERLQQKFPELAVLRAAA